MEGVDQPGSGSRPAVDWEHNTHRFTGMWAASQDEGKSRREETLGGRRTGGGNRSTAVYGRRDAVEERRRDL